MADLTIPGLRALLDADPDIQSLMVGEGLLWELLDAAAERDQLRQQVAELTERAELAEQTAQARDETLGQWVTKVERTADIEADLTRVGEAMRDERRRLAVVADLTRVRRAVEACGDRAAIVAMRIALDAAGLEAAAADTADSATRPAVDGRAVADASLRPCGPDCWTCADQGRTGTPPEATP